MDGDDGLGLHSLRRGRTSVDCSGVFESRVAMQCVAISWVGLPF
jgi:hypothetical protein